MSPGRNDPSASRGPSPPPPAIPPCAAPSRPARGMSGLGIRQVLNTSVPLQKRPGWSSSAIWESESEAARLSSQPKSRPLDVQSQKNPGQLFAAIWARDKKVAWSSCKSRSRRWDTRLLDAIGYRNISQYRTLQPGHANPGGIKHGFPSLRRPNTNIPSPGCSNLQIPKKQICDISNSHISYPNLKHPTFVIQNPETPNAMRGTARHIGLERDETGRSWRGDAEWSGTEEQCAQGTTNRFRHPKRSNCCCTCFRRTNVLSCVTASRIQNPDIPRAGRDVAAHGGTAWRGGDGQDGTPTGLFAQETTVPFTFQKIV